MDENDGNGLLDEGLLRVVKQIIKNGCFWIVGFIVLA
jgi:hypothetical protein